MSGHDLSPAHAEYVVVSPEGQAIDRHVRREGATLDLAAARIGELWDYGYRGEEVFTWIRQELSATYPGIEFVTYDAFGDIHGPDEREVVAALADRLKAHRIDAVLAAVGA